MIVPGVCKSPHDSPRMTYDAMKAMADLLGRGLILRASPALFRMFLTPDKTDFDALDYLVDIALRAGWRVLIDPSSPPAWATGGKGAYVCSVEGSSCQILAQWGVPRRIAIEAFDPQPEGMDWDVWSEIYGAVVDSGDDSEAIARVERLITSAARRVAPPLGNTSAKIAWHFVRSYRAERGCAWAWEKPEALGTPADPHGPVHVWGTKGFEEQDKLSAQRPWLLSAATMPHVDPKAMQYMGETLADRYDGKAWAYGVSINEPDIDLFNPLIRYDGVNGGDGGDTVRDRLIPEQVAPFIAGLRSRMSPLGARILGPNVAYAGTLPRFDGIGNDVDGNHLYGDESDFPKSSYAHAYIYADLARQARLPWGCSEFDRVTGLVGWLKGLLELNLNPQFVIFYEGNRFIEGWSNGGTEPTQEGRDLSALLQQVNGKRHAAGGK